VFRRPPERERHEKRLGQLDYVDTASHRVRWRIFVGLRSAQWANSRWVGGRVLDIVVLDNPAKFTAPLKFGIRYRCTASAGLVEGVALARLYV